MKRGIRRKMVGGALVLATALGLANAPLQAQHLEPGNCEDLQGSLCATVTDELCINILVIKYCIKMTTNYYEEIKVT